MHDAARSSIDFINYLTDEALNLAPDSLDANKTAAELFTSDEFIAIGQMVNTWKGLHAVTGERLLDFIQKYDAQI